MKEREQVSKNDKRFNVGKTKKFFNISNDFVRILYLFRKMLNLDPNYPTLPYRMPEMRFPSCEIEEDNFRVSHGKQIRTNRKESFESKVQKQSNFALQSPLPPWFRKLPDVDLSAVVAWSCEAVDKIGQTFHSYKPQHVGTSSA